MGGLMILTSLTLSILLWMDLKNPYVWACLCVTLGFGAIGFLDDYDKVRKGSSAGVSGKMRLLGEFAVAGSASYLIVLQNGTNQIGRETCRERVCQSGSSSVGAE